MTYITVYKFPQERDIKQFLDTDKRTQCNEPQWGVHEVIAQLFAETVVPEEVILLAVTMTVTVDLKKQIPLSPFFLGDAAKNIIHALKSCAQKMDVDLGADDVVTDSYTVA